MCCWKEKSKKPIFFACILPGHLLSIRPATDAEAIAPGEFNCSRPLEREPYSTKQSSFIARQAVVVLGRRGIFSSLHRTQRHLHKRPMATQP